MDEKLNQIDTKQRGFTERFSLVEKRLLTLEDKNYNTTKNNEEHKLKELKHSGDIR